MANWRDLFMSQQLNLSLTFPSHFLQNIFNLSLTFRLPFTSHFLHNIFNLSLTFPSIHIFFTIPLTSPLPSLHLTFSSQHLNLSLTFPSHFLRNIFNLSLTFPSHFTHLTNYRVWGKSYRKLKRYQVIWQKSGKKSQVA